MSDNTNYTEEGLLASIRMDDEKAFKELFKKYWRKAHRMAYAKVRSKEIAEEIVQDIFTTLWDKRATLQINNFSSYLFTTVKNKSLNYIQACLVRKKYWDYYKQFIPQYEESTEKAVAYNELVEAIEHEMILLPEKSEKVTANPPRTGSFSGARQCSSPAHHAPRDPACRATPRRPAWRRY